MPVVTAVLVVLALVVGVGLGVAAVAFRSGSRLGAARRMRQQLLADARREAEALRRETQIEAREQAVRLRAELEEELKERRAEVLRAEERLRGRGQELEAKLTELTRREQGVADREMHTKQLQEDLKAAKDGELKELERISGMTVGEAKAHILERSEDLVRHELARRVRQLEEEARGEAKRKARNLVADALQRVAASHAAETTVSIVELPSDDMKGRIIGREGRNIRALELHTGVDLIVDDTPEAVLISAYDPYRREIARLALQKLIADGRIHPARIEEVVEKVKKDMEEHLKEEGDKACFEVGVHGLHPELVKLVGRMKYRTSYGQNCLQHSKEVAWLAGMMAAEIKADVKLAKRMGLLHDIGKALTHEQEGSHPELSLQVLTKWGESPQIINAALCGHENVEPETIEAVLTEAADGISAARPGARRDVLESYIKRLAKLEEIAMSYKGVEMCYAIQAGRELRIMTKSEQISDLDAHQLAKDISKRIEAEMQYPGHIKVIVIRETRAVEVAK